MNQPVKLSILLLMFSSQLLYSDIQDYMQTGTTSPFDCDKNKVYLLSPEAPVSAISFKLNEEELALYRSKVRTALIPRFGNNIFEITPDNLKDMEECPVKVFVVRIVSYNAVEKNWGQHKSTIILEVATFCSVTDKKPCDVKQYRGTGKKHWGDNVPFFTAVDAALKQLKKE